MRKNNYSFGLLLIVIAVVLLLGKLGVFNFLGHLFWPIFVLAPGLILHFLYFGRMAPGGVLIPGGILVTYSLLFFYCNLFGWGLMSYMWPAFIFGPAVGLYEYQLFDRHAPRGVFTASVVLALIAAIFFGIAFLYTLGVYLIAIILIAVGAVMVVRRWKLW